WSHLAPDLDSLPQRVARSGTEILWPSGRPAGDRVPLVGGRHSCATAVLPMRGSGMLVGVLTAIWPAPLPGFEPPLLRQLTALPGGLFDRAVEVLASGVPDHVSGGILSSLVSEAGVTALMDIRVARLFGGVVIALRRVDEAERLASLLEHAERLGRIGGWEEN